MRITPAYAGKSEIVPRFENGIKDHPRLCGEKEILQGGDEKCMGSPPPMRGKVDETISIYIDEGITPAYAGKREFSKLPIIVR